MILFEGLVNSIRSEAQIKILEDLEQFEGLVNSIRSEAVTTDKYELPVFEGLVNSIRSEAMMSTCQKRCCLRVLLILKVGENVNESN